MQTKNQLPSVTFGNIGNSSNTVMTYLEPKTEPNYLMIGAGLALLIWLARRKKVA